MNEVSSTHDLRGRGLSGDDVARLIVGGQLTRIRRGGYVHPSDPEFTRPAVTRTPEDDHRELLAASLPLLHTDAVLSHGSAAVLHGLPVWGRAVEQVHVTRDRSNGARRRTYVQVHGAPLTGDEIVLRYGWPTTSLPRTVVDLGRTLPFADGVAVADRALAAGVRRAELEAAVRRATGWPGVRRARQAVAFASSLAESPGESVSRVRIEEYGLPRPTPQFEVRNRAGVLIGRCDFGWPELRTLGEFDGKIKYGRLVRPGDTVSEVVYREKLREDQLRDLNWQMVRWTTADLPRFGPVADSLRRAFARSNIRSNIRSNTP